MPRRPTRTAPTVLIHGLDGSGPGHWQNWLADELTTQGRQVYFPLLPDAAKPQLDAWLDCLQETVRTLPEGGYDLLAHSLGALLWLHHSVSSAGSTAGMPRPARVALISPPAPEVPVPDCEDFFPVPLDVDAIRAAADGTVLVGSDNDPFCPAGVAKTYGAPLKMAATVIPGAGHINIDSGMGPWPAVLDWCGRDNLAFRA